MTERELLNVIEKLETALNNVVDKADRAHNSSNGNFAGTVNSRPGKNPYDENSTSASERRKYQKYEELLREQHEFGLALDKKRADAQLVYWGRGYKKAAKEQQEYQIELDKERQLIQLDFWKQNKDAIKDQQEYQIQLDKKRRQAEIDFYEEKKDKIKKLDEYEASLIKKRKEIELRQREGKLTQEKWEQRGYNKDGKETTLAPMMGAIGKFAAKFKTMSPGKLLNEAVSKAGGAAAKGLNFIGEDKEHSITEVGNKVADMTSNIPFIGGITSGLIKAFTATLELYDKINKASSSYARSVGGGVTKMQQMKFEATGIASRISSWGGKAYKFDKILEHTAALSEKTGRVMDHMADADFKSLEDLTQWGISNDVISQMDTFGLSVETIDKRIKEIYNSSGKHGLNAKAVTDTVNKNLQMAQRYTFAGGLRAIERMAEKSVALKYNMESVAKFADKVSTLEGAAKTGAQLSVLGSNFARIGNPLSMLYGGLQDPERLNEMMLNMTKNMAHWDSELGEIRITAYNRQRLKAAADAMGVSYDDMLNQAMMQSRRNMIDNQLDSADFNTDEREYIQNLAQIDENGRAYIKFTGSDEPTYLEDMSEGQRAQLKKESELMEDKKNAKIGDVLVQTKTITEQLNDFIDTFKQKFLKVFLNLVREYLDGNEKFAKMMGLNSGNAEFFDDFVDDYDSGGLSTNAIARLSEIYEKLGMKQDLQYEKIMKNEMSTEEFMTYIGGLMNQLQDEKGLSYNGNGFLQYGQNYSLNNSSKWGTMTTKDSYNKEHSGEIRGKGTSMSDSIPAMLSDGEFVVNSKAAQEHLPTLKAWNANKYSKGTPDIISASEIQTNPISVREGGSNVGYSMDIPQLKIEPINLNVSGTINLSCNGALRSINANELLNNNMFINQLIASIESATHYGLDKTKIHMKYPVSTYMA